MPCNSRVCKHSYLQTNEAWCSLVGNYYSFRNTENSTRTDILAEVKSLHDQSGREAQIVIRMPIQDCVKMQPNVYTHSSVIIQHDDKRYLFCFFQLCKHKNDCITRSTFDHELWARPKGEICPNLCCFTVAWSSAQCWLSCLPPHPHRLWHQRGLQRRKVLKPSLLY